jgi:hypothetical protein
VGDNNAREKWKAMATEIESVSFEPESAEELRRFFEVNKNKYREFWVVLAKKKLGTQPVSFNEAVGEAVEQGLIDSRTKTLNEQKYAIRFTKKRTKKASVSLK